MSKLEGEKWRPGEFVVLLARTFLLAVSYKSSSRCLELKNEGMGEAITSIYPAWASNNESLWCMHCGTQDYSPFQAADIGTLGPICSRRSH